MEALKYFDKHSITGLAAINVAELYQQQRWQELDLIVISASADKQIISTFGDDEWNLVIYHHRHSSASDSTIKFSTIKNTTIKTELKLAIYGALHYPVGLKGMLKVSTLKGVSGGLNKISRYLEENNVKSLTQLNEVCFDEILRVFGETLSQNSIYQLICHVNKIHLLASKIGFLVPSYISNPSRVAKEHVTQGKKIARQFAALPTNTLVNLINYLSEQLVIIEKYAPVLAKMHEKCLQIETYKSKRTRQKRHELTTILESGLISTPLWRFITTAYSD